MTINCNTSTVKLKDYLKLVKSGKLLLPDFQRAYVWSDDRICSLFDSIVDNYPIGSLIVWNPTRKEYLSSKTEFVTFAEEIALRRNENKVKSRVTLQNGNVKAVLDGQQRLTSLYLVLSGKIEKRVANEYYKLCFNLNRTKNDARERFAFVKESDIDRSVHYPMEDIYSLNSKKFQISITDYRPTDKKILTNLWNQLNMNSIDGYKLSVFEIQGCTYDEALDIFVKVNSSGKHLTKTDLILSKLASKGCKNVSKKALKTYTKTINNKERYNFSIDNVLHMALVLSANSQSNRNLNVKNIGLAANSIEVNWVNIKKAIDRTVKVLKTKGFYDICISSYNAIIPIAYYFYKGGRDNDDDETAIQQYLIRAALSHLYSHNTDGVINRCIESIDHMLADPSKGFDIKTMINDIPDLDIKSPNIDEWMKLEKGVQTRLILCYLQMNATPYTNDYDQDHLYPRAPFEENVDKLTKFYPSKGGVKKKKKMSDADKRRWKKLCNTLPNLDMLSSTTNKKKTAKDLESWMALSGNVIQYDPKCGYDFEHFEMFYERRKALMKTEIEKMLTI